MAPRPSTQKTTKFWPWLVGGAGIAVLVVIFSRGEDAPLPALVNKIASRGPVEQKSMPAEAPKAPGAASSAEAGAGPSGGGGGGGGGGGIEARREFFLCGQADKGIYFLPRQYLKGVLGGEQKVTVLIDDESRCLVSGRVYDVGFVEYDTARRVPWKLNHAQKGTVAKIEDFPSVAEFLQKYDAKALGFASQHEMFGALVRAMGSDYQRFPLRAVTWSFAAASSRGYVAVPPIHPLAPAATAEEVRGGGAVVVDVSISQEPSPVPKAVLFTEAGVKLMRKILPYGSARSMVAATDNAILSQIPKNEKVILLAMSETDGTAYNLVNILHAMGYRNLAFFRGGRLALQGKSLATPEAVAGISTVDLATARSLAEDAAHTLIVDTRAVTDFMQASLPGAKAHPYREVKGPSVLRSANMKMAELAATGEKYEVPRGKAAVLFYGSNELDWKALKAAVFARDSGMKKVYWFRKGMEEWRFPELLGRPLKTQQNKDRETQAKAWQEHNILYPSLTYDNLRKNGLKAPPRGSGAVLPAEDKGYLLLTPNLVGPQFEKKSDR